MCCVLCVVCGAAWHAVVCGFKTPRCGPAKTCACVQHAQVLHVHTEAFFTGGLSPSLSSPSIFLSSLLVSLFLRSLHSYFSRYLSLLSSLLSSLSATMTMITRPVGSLSLSVHTALTCHSVRVRGPWPIPCWPNMFASCKKQLSWHDYANLVPLGMKWACICAGNG